MADVLEFGIDGAIARLTLNRPEKLNALNRRLLSEVLDACRAIERDRRVKAVILKGAGRAFSAGADLAEFAGYVGEQAMEGLRERSELARQVGQTIETMRALVIGQLHGRVVGGASVLALACDLRLMAEGTTLWLPEAEMGSPLGWGGIPRLVRELGPSRTKHLVLLAEPIDAAEAARLGLAIRVVAPGELEAQAEALAATLSTRTSLALTVTKRHVNAVADAIASPTRSYAEDDILALTVADPETAAVRGTYSARVTSPDRAGPAA